MGNRIGTNKYGYTRDIRIDVNLANILLRVLKDSENSTENCVKYGIEHEDLLAIQEIRNDIEEASNDRLIHVSWSTDDVMSVFIENEEEIEEDDTIEPIYSITEEEASKMLVDAKKFHDCNCGITWDTFKNM